MKFMTLQVPDNNYEFFKELMNKLDIKTTDDNGMFISEEQKEMVRERIRNTKPETLKDIDAAMSQMKFDEKI